MMRMICAALMLTCAAAQAEEQRTFRDAIGREIGRSVTATGSGTSRSTYYDAMGRTTGRSVTTNTGTTFYDQAGRVTGRSGR